MAGLYSQVNYFRKRGQDPGWMQTDVRREAAEWGSCSVLPWHRSCALPTRFCWSGTREGDKPYLQLRNLENVQNHHADGNLLLSIVPYLKPHTGHAAAKAAGSLSQHSAAWGRRGSMQKSWVPASVPQRCGIIAMHWEWSAASDTGQAGNQNKMLFCFDLNYSS